MAEADGETLTQTGSLDGLPQHYSEHKGVALVIKPHTIGEPNTYDVIFYPIENGKPNFNNSINSHIFDIGSLNDVPEIADRYRALLLSGVPVVNIFEDLEKKSK